MNREYLERKTQGLLVDVIGSSLEITNRHHFATWARNELRALFPHKMLLGCVGRVDRSGSSVESAMGVDWPVEYVEAIKSTDGKVGSPIVARWLAERRPQIFEPGNGQFAVPPGWLATFNKYELQNIAAHGVLAPDHRTATYFTFSQIDQKLSDRHALLLELLVPHMHQAFVRIISSEREKVARKTPLSSMLTPKELEVLPWLAAGKTNPEIAVILSRSPCTVRNQVHVILTKLNVVSRAQAVAAAKDLNLLGCR